jgi:hypothetical protein
MSSKLFVRLIGIIVILFWVSPVIAGETIRGHYCYTYGDRESIQEARELTRTLAIRNAIESFRTYIESTGRVTNFTLTNDIIQIISSGYLKNIKVLEHKEVGNTVCDKISAIVEPKEIEKAIEKQISIRTKKIEDMGLDNNGYAKILSISGNEYKGKIQVDVTVKSLKKFWSNDEHGIIFVTIYDNQGNETHTQKKECFRDFGEKVTNVYPGEVKRCYIESAYGHTYKVWLLGGKQSISNEDTKANKKKLIKKKSPK